MFLIGQKIIKWMKAIENERMKSIYFGSFKYLPQPIEDIVSKKKMMDRINLDFQLNVKKFIHPYLPNYSSSNCTSFGWFRFSQSLNENFLQLIELNYILSKTSKISIQK